MSRPRWQVVQNVHERTLARAAHTRWPSPTSASPDRSGFQTGGVSFRFHVGRDASALSHGCSSLVMRVRDGTRTRTDSWPRGRIWCALLRGGAVVLRRGGTAIGPAMVRVVRSLAVPISTSVNNAGPGRDAPRIVGCRMCSTSFVTGGEHSVLTLLPDCCR
jgi:hypothetical protein